MPQAQSVSLQEIVDLAANSSNELGAWVTDDQIQAILNVCRDTPQHVYFLLTKNAPRLLRFDYPRNVLVGVSSPPDFLLGHELAGAQKERLLRRALDVLSDLNGGKRWMSFEPLSWDVTPIVADFPRALDWMVIGAASAGRRYFAPEERHVRSLVELADSRQIPVFFKGNLETLGWARDHWRAEFPRLQEVSR